MRLLNNILLSGLALLILVACSKEDEKEMMAISASAKLSIGIKATEVTTKAVNENEVGGKINNLAVVVFSQDGKQVLGSLWQATLKTESSAIIADVPAKAEVARIVVLANVPREIVTNIANWYDLYVQMVELSSQTPSNQPMCSEMITTDSPLKKGDNYIGFNGIENVNGISTPIYLTRATLRSLMKITANFFVAKLEGESPEYNYSGT